MAAAKAAVRRLVLAPERDRGFVHFDKAVQKRAARRHHCAPELGKKQPCRFIGPKPELAFKLQCREAIGMARREIGGPEPKGERQLRAVHDCARSDRGLTAASRALKGEALPAVGPSLGLAAGRTVETIGPAGRKKIGRAVFFVRKPLLKLHKRMGRAGHEGHSCMFPFCSKRLFLPCHLDFAFQDQAG